MPLLCAAIKVNVVVVGIEFFLGDRDLLAGASDVDVVLFFIGVHNLSFPPGRQQDKEKGLGQIDPRPLLAIMSAQR